MIRIVIIALAIAACTDAPAPAPSVWLAPGLDESPILDEYIAGAEAWAPLGFTFTTDDEPGLRMCRANWFEIGEVDCRIVITIERTPARARCGEDSCAIDRRVIIDYAITDSRELQAAAAHAVGHVLLATARHTTTGVMSGGATALEPADYQLACETINICEEP